MEPRPRDAARLPTTPSTFFSTTDELIDPPFQCRHRRSLSCPDSPALAAGESPALEPWEIAAALAREPPRSSREMSRPKQSSYNTRPINTSEAQREQLGARLPKEDQRANVPPTHRAEGRGPCGPRKASFLRKPFCNVFELQVFFEFAATTFIFCVV